MRMYGFTSTGVQASSSQYGSRQRITSLPVAASHNLIEDEEGNINNGNSMRFGNDGQKLLFSWMEKNPHMHGDLSDIVRIKEDRNTLTRRDPKVQMMV